MSQSRWVKTYYCYGYYYYLPYLGNKHLLKRWFWPRTHFSPIACDMLWESAESAGVRCHGCQLYSWKISGGWWCFDEETHGNPHDFANPTIGSIYNHIYIYIRSILCSLSMFIPDWPWNHEPAQWCYFRASCFTAQLAMGLSRLLGPQRPCFPGRSGPRPSGLRWPRTPPSGVDPLRTTQFGRSETRRVRELRGNSSAVLDLNRKNQGFNDV